MLYCFGVRVWLCRIMVIWGLVLVVMMFVDDVMIFYVLCFLLGVVEVGFFFGIIFYFIYWFLQCSCVQVFGLFYFGLLLVLVLGGLLFGWLLEFYGIFGLVNWQWLFVIEGLLVLLVGIVVYFYLVDCLCDVGWLSDEQKWVLEGELVEEDICKQVCGLYGFFSVLCSGQVLKFCLVYFIIQMSVYGVVFYLLICIVSFFDGQVGLNVGLIIVIFWVCVLVVMCLVICQVDCSGQYCQFVVVMLGMVVVGIVVLVLVGSLGLVVIVFCFVVFGFVLVQLLFWIFFIGYLSGVVVVSGIVLINFLGNFGGFVVLNFKIFMESQFVDLCVGMFVLVVVGLFGVCLLVWLKIFGLLFVLL